MPVPACFKWHADPCQLANTTAAFTAFTPADVFTGKKVYCSDLEFTPKAEDCGGMP